MRLELLHRRHSSALSASLLLQHAWKFGLGALILAVIATSRSAAPAALHASPRALAANTVPTTVQCGTIPVDPTTQTAVWNASGSPYILPWNDPKIPSTDTTRQPNCLTTDAHGNQVGDDVHLAAGTKLIIDGSQGPVKIFSHGTGISVDGGEIRTISTDATNFVSFDAEPDVASWDGIAIHASDPAHLGKGSFSYVTIQHALTAINIDSGATSSPDSANYGLTVANSGIGPSYFDGIDARNTPISITGLGDGQYGTVNNIGSQGINVTFDSAPTINDDALKVTGITFGSSVPFGESGCPPEPQPCANRVVGSIGNNAVIGTLLASISRPVVIDQNRFFRAGSFGIDLENANKPQVTNNDFVCNGSGSPTPVTTCTANGTLQKFSAIYLNNVTADLLPDPPATVPPAPPALATGGVSNNVGQENGLDAVVVSGRITSDVTWRTPTNDPNGPDVHAPHDLGYMVANVAGTGGIELIGKTLTVGDGDVVKVMGGGITLTGGSLKAGSTGLKSFTSMRDNGVGIQACPSVFVQTCLATVPSNEWIGIDLSAATGTINNANILFPTKGVYASGAPTTVAAPDGHSYGLVVTGSRIGPTFSDGVATSGTAAYVAGSSFCRIDSNTLKPDGTTPNPTYNTCIGAGPGDHGINADFSGLAGSSALTLLNNSIQGSANEGILGTGLAPVRVDLEANSINKAGAYGLRLTGAQNPTITKNVITNSGTGATTYSAMLLAGLGNANFQKFSMPVPPSPSCTTACISWNTGYGNGLDAVAFDGSTGPLTWMSPANVTASAPLGYILDNSLQVNGALTLNAQDLIEIVRGKITVSGGALSANNALVSSIKQGANNLPQGFGAVKLPTCGSVFDPLSSGRCPAPGPGDWTGLVLDGTKPNTLTGSTIRYASTGIEIDQPANQPLSLAQTNIQEVADSGIHSESYLVVNGGQISNTARSTGNGIWFDHGANISGSQISKTGQEGIVGIGLNTDPVTGVPVVISGTAIDSAGTYGIRLMPAGQALAGGGLTITNNAVTNSGTGASPYPAIYLNGVSTGVLLYPGEIAAPASSVSIQGNKGNGNGLDALAFHGSVARNLTWLTAYKNQPAQRLGYLLDGDLDMNGYTLTVNAGDIVKVGNGGTINMDGGRLHADDTGSSSQKIFTTLADNSAGVAACPSVFLPAGCSAATSYWSGIKLPVGVSSLLSDGTLVNAAIRYAKTGISISSGATATFASSVYGLVVERSTIGPIQLDAINSTATAISVTNSTINGTGGVHGITADLTGAHGIPLRFSGNRFMSTSAEAILGQALAGQPVWITDNQIQHAGTFGIRLLNADELVLRNNNISTSGTGSTIYPAAYLAGVTANFSTDVRGNMGQGNGINAIVVDGKANGDFSWITPPSAATPPTKPLGYMLDGGLVLQGGTLTVRSGDVVKALGGPITISGGTLNAGDVGQKTFTSVKDPGGFTSCPSFFAVQCGPNKGDWGGLVLTSNAAQARGSGTIDNSLISYASTGISIDSGPIAAGETGINFRLTVLDNTNISNGSKDGINAFDTPISVTNSTIANVDGEGIVASFFSPANCALLPPPCSRLTITGTHVNFAGKDGILANGLGGEPIFVTGNTVDHAGTYGIRLVGADQLTLTDNTITNSGGGGTALRYPAIYLSRVKADFEVLSGTGTVAGNHGSGNGLNVVAADGEATKKMTWLTTGTTAVADHFGYVLTGGLTVDGDLTTNPGDNVKVLTGTINVNGALKSTGTASSGITFTSLKDGSVPIAACDSATFDSVFIQRVMGSCPSPTSGDWGGITTTAGATLAYTTISFDDGLTVSGGALSFGNGSMHNIKQNAIVVNGFAASVTNTTFTTVGGDGIDSTNSGSTDTITDNTFSGITGVSISLNNAPATLSRNTFTTVGGDGIDSTNSGSTDTITDNTFNLITGASINLNNAPATLSRNTFFAGVGSPAVKTTGASVSLDCSRIQAGGVSGDSGLVVKQSNFSPGVGVKAPAGASAEFNWWGQAGGPSGQLSGGITVANFYASTHPSAAIAVTGKPASPAQPLDNVKSDGSIGTGLVEATVSSDRDMNTTESGVPLVTSMGNTVTFSGGSWKDKRTFVVDAPIGAPLSGSQSVSASGAHSCVPDPQATGDNLMVPAGPQTFTVDTSSLPTVTVGAPDLIGSGSARMHGHIVPNGWATGAVNSGQFVLTNTANPLDRHTYNTPPVSDKTTPLDFTLIADHLSASATYSIHLNVPSVNGTATEVTADSVTTTGPASKAVFSSDPPGSITAGSSFGAAVSAKDASGNVVADFAGSVTVSLTTPNGAALRGVVSQTLVNGVATFSGLSVNKTGSYTLTPTSAPALSQFASGSFTITPAPTSKLVWSVPATATAGTPVSATLTAKDSFDNVTPGYTGTVSLTSSDGAAVLNPTPYTFAGADAGIHMFSITFKTATTSGGQTVTANDGTLAGTSSSVSVSAAAASQLLWTTPANATKGSAVSGTLTAKDTFGNVATSYTGTVTLTSSTDGAAVFSPTPFTFGAGDAGKHTFSLTFNTSGPQTVTASDGTLSGTSATINVS